LHSRESLVGDQAEDYTVKNEVEALAKLPTKFHEKEHLWRTTQWSS